MAFCSVAYTKHRCKNKTRIPHTVLSIACHWQQALKQQTTHLNAQDTHTTYSAFNCMSLTKSTQTTNNTHKCTRQAYHIQCFCLHVTEKQAHKQQTTHFNAQDTHTTYSAFNCMSLTESTQTTNNTHKCTRHAYHIQCFRLHVTDNKHTNNKQHTLMHKTRIPHTVLSTTSLTKSTQTTNNTHKCTRHAYHIQCFRLHVTDNKHTNNKQHTLMHKTRIPHTVLSTTCHWQKAHKQQTTHINARDTHTTYNAFKATANKHANGTQVVGICITSQDIVISCRRVECSGFYWMR